MKVGKATLRGVSKIQNKLGPLGSIAMAIAMPYALGGLSTATTAAMNSTNTFLKSIGTIGNQIRTGYQAFNARLLMLVYQKVLALLHNLYQKVFKSLHLKELKICFLIFQQVLKIYITQLKIH
jgi:hypothetical protein